MRIFSEIIKKYRIMKSRSQAQLAADAGITSPALADYETGKKAPKIEIRERLAHALQVDPVEMMGLDLTEEDEIRLLNKLLVKYCISMGISTDNDSPGPNRKQRVIVSLPESFVPLQEVYERYQQDIAELRSMIGDEMTDEQFAEYLGTKEAKDEMDFWLENWPEYDYLYQANKNDVDPLSITRHSLKENLYSKYQTRFFDFQDIYLMPKYNEEMLNKIKKKDEQ